MLKAMTKKKKKMHYLGEIHKSKEATLYKHVKDLGKSMGI